MSQYVNTPVRVQHRIEADKFSDATMEVETISTLGRIGSAFGALLLCWVIAALCILIPVMHFFLVPLGVIAGVVAFFVRLRLGSRRTATELKCPACQAPLHLKAGSFNFPLKESCGACRSGLIISPRPG